MVHIILCIVTQYVRMSFNNKPCSSINDDIILEVINYMKSLIRHQWKHFLKLYELCLPYKINRCRTIEIAASVK